MAKWAGIIGFAIQKEQKTNGIPNGIWEEIITEKHYTGDSYKQRRSFQNFDSINDKINISNQISFVADPYALNNFNYMRYATFMGFKWKIKDVDVEYPRLILTLGDAYNE